MPRISKAAKAQKEQITIRREAAKKSLVDGIAKLIEKHVDNFIKPGTATDGVVTMKIDENGRGALRIEYRTTISEGLAVTLDDGQKEMFEPGQEPGPSEPQPAAGSTTD